MKTVCAFCKIITGELESVKIWEGRDVIAILDINPNTKGMALLITKTHYDSDIFSMPEKAYIAFLHAAKSIAHVLEQSLKVKRVALVAEGMGVNHAHIKLYPLHGLSKKFKETWAKKRIYFKRYAGYLSTQLGPQAKFTELRRIAQTISRNIKKSR